MKNLEKFEKAFNYFKESYAYKMGGTQTVVLPNGKSKEFDDRSYYQGRGAKYNSSIRHDNIGIVKVSKKEYSSFIKMLKEREENKKIAMKNQQEKEAKYAEMKSKGIYGVKNIGWTNVIELSDEEIHGKYFDAERLAKTLDISIDDAELVASTGKTYVYAKQLSTGKTIELYHASLECNSLNITVEFNAQDKLEEKDHDEWASAPFSRMVGQTSNRNHFVC